MPPESPGPLPEAATPAAGAPSWHPPRDVLEVCELVLGGLIDPRPLPVPDGIAAAASGCGLVIEDAEGTPVAFLAPAGPGERWNAPPRLSALKPFTHGPLRRHRRAPGEVAAELAALPEGPVFAVPVVAALGAAAVDAVADTALRHGARVLWLVLVGHGRRIDLPAEGLWRAVRAVSADLQRRGVRGLTVPVALPTGDDPGLDPARVEDVARRFGAEAVLRISGAGGALHPACAEELARAVPPPHRRGVTVFFTGLSGSGKSTIARGLAERLADDGRRRASVLDGDEVRRLLSAGLTFSAADRELNIRRIGYVAAEVTRHGGLAICAPIAPFARVRAEVRARVEEVGDFVLVHVATPLAECERRDRKGLYARARQGLVPEFTGISSPYELPHDADLVLDTTGTSVEAAVDAVWSLLVSRGYL